MQEAVPYRVTSIRIHRSLEITSICGSCCIGGRRSSEDSLSCRPRPALRRCWYARTLFRSHFTAPATRTTPCVVLGEYRMLDHHETTELLFLTFSHAIDYVFVTTLVGIHPYAWKAFIQVSLKVSSRCWIYQMQ